MKCCVIYTGAYNATNICLESHKEYIFDILEKNNIDYNVNICVSPCINIKHPSKEIFKSNPGKLNRIFEENINPNSAQKHNHVYMIEKNIEIEYMKKKFYSIIKQEKIKEFFFCNDIANTYINNMDDIHSSDGFFITHFYKRSKIMQEKIDDKNYDFIIHLRPDFLIQKSIDGILQKVKLLNEDFIFLNYRHDFFYISNKIFCKKLSKENFDKILKNEDENDITSLKYIIKNGKYPGIFHMEVYAKELYEKLNIKLEHIGIGERFNINLFKNS